MKTFFTAFLGAYRAEMMQMFRSPALVVLTIIQAITFLLLVSLFGLTGSMAPTAIINNDNGVYSKLFIADLASTHHSFRLESLARPVAHQLLSQGKLVAIITIPQGFSQSILQGKSVPVNVEIDNVDADLTDDIQRALPSAIIAFGKRLHFPGIRVQIHEVDLLKKDTGFIPYLIVSALALDAFVIAGILSAIAVAREYETKTIRLLTLSPVHPLIPFMGRILAADTFAFAGMVISAAIVITGYKVIPLHPIEMLGTLLTCVIIFGCIGAVVGISLRRVLPIAALIFGLALPLYIDSGALEPERFDGNIIWTIAHFSPIYYAVGLLENAFHGFQVTPEPVSIDFLLLIVWAFFMLFLCGTLIRRNSKR